jgi:cyanophycinase
MKYLAVIFAAIALVLIPPVFSQSKGPSSKETYPEAESRGPGKGTLLIIGGNASEIFYEKFMELAGGPDAPIVVIPTATTSEELSPEDLEDFRNSFVKRGFRQVTVLHTRDREVANSEEFVLPIREARGVWFSGGRQWRHADSYLHTLTHEAFFDLLNRGGVIAGSSAGATIQGSYLARGDTRKNTIMAGDHEEGLGFVSNVAIDQHLLARNRQFDMFEILEKYPGLLGIGLDEDTGIIVEGDQFSVFGNSYVAIYDGSRWSAERDTVYSLAPDSRDFYFLHEGQQYHLKERRVITE